MRSSPTLISVLLLLALTSRPAFSAALAIGEAVPRPEADPFGVSDLPVGEDVAENVVETEAFSELDEDDVSEDVLVPAAFRRVRVRVRCVYDRGSKRLRCFWIRQVIPLRR
ncbi:unnamed protein product [Taenia asiatica]|uniref:Secreted protein n=1 Tax=Taenia asiatica TaxID=60517 RepID=A0A0R3WHF2_TAEAS|nr:unnamed protein product [Taenia asiatica]